MNERLSTAVKRNFLYLSYKLMNILKIKRERNLKINKGLYFIPFSLIRKITHRYK